MQFVRSTWLIDVVGIALVVGVVNVERAVSRMCIAYFFSNSSIDFPIDYIIFIFLKKHTHTKRIQRRWWPEAGRRRRCSDIESSARRTADAIDRSVAARFAYAHVRGRSCARAFATAQRRSTSSIARAARHRVRAAVGLLCRCSERRHERRAVRSRRARAWLEAAAWFALRALFLPLFYLFFLYKKMNLSCWIYLFLLFLNKKYIISRTMYRSGGQHELSVWLRATDAPRTLHVALAFYYEAGDADGDSSTTPNDGQVSE